MAKVTRVSESEKFASKIGDGCRSSRRGQIAPVQLGVDSNLEVQKHFSLAALRIQAAVSSDCLSSYEMKNENN